jgi:DNA-binding NarL/FixJ family response regulator
MRSGIIPSGEAAPSVREYLVVEDHNGFGQRFARVLRKWGKPTVVITLRDAIAAIRSQRWTALFVDPGLPDGSGLDAIAEFRALQPFAPVLVLTGGAAGVERERAWSLGARYVEKPDVTEAFVEDFLRSGSMLEAHLAELASARHNERYVSHKEPETAGFDLAFDTAKSAGAGLFSDRERDIVLRLSLGHSTKAIAHALGLSPSTVRVHLARAAAKIGARSRRDLIDKAVRLGLLPSEGPGRHRGGLGRR